VLECTNCGAVRVGGEPCFHCGFLPQRPPRGVDFADGDLGLVDVSRRRAAGAACDPAERERWHQMLVHIGEERSYKPGWAAYKFKEKFGTWPDRRAVPPLSPTPEVRSWVRSPQIAFARAQSA
jgi:DNA repair protein RadD